MNYLNKISVFRSYTDPSPAMEVSVLDFCKNVIGNVKGSDYKREITKLRQVEDKEQQKEHKSVLPAVSISGLFTQRGNDFLIRHSGFICLDLDAKGNESITDWPALRDSLSSMDEVFFSALSASGQGVFLIVPIASPADHRGHFLALERDFKDIGLVVDKATKDVSRLRGISFDENAILNVDARTYTRVYAPPKPKQHAPSPGKSPRFEKLVQWTEKKTSFTKGSRHDFITTLAGACHRFGIPEHETRSELMRYQQDDFRADEIEKIVSYMYKNQTFKGAAL